MTRRFDIAVIGGGPAGLSAAVVLGRSRRSVVVIDAGSPRNAPATGVHGFLSRDGVSPAELLAAGRKEVEQYGGLVLTGEARSARRDAEEFEVTLDDGGVLHARRLLIATGLVDDLPDIPGVRERWGRDVVHCPYCHGWEIRDQAIGVLATGPRAVRQALLFRQLTSDLVLFTHTAPDLSGEEAMRLATRGVRIVAGTVDSLVVDDDSVTGVRMSDGTVIARQAVAVSPQSVVSSTLLTSLGLQPSMSDFGEFIAADETGLTEVPGVWVAGNVADPAAHVVSSAAGGVAAGAAINADLIADASAVFGKEFWDERYRSAHKIWSGNPNPQLVALVADLAPGTALDIGSGEGADAIWLASRGWQVTGVDISNVALERAAGHAAEAGDEVAERITWRQADVLSWDPAPMRYDLVSAQFMQVPSPARETLHRRLAVAVRPGGTLLIVGHHPSDLDTSIHRPHFPERMFTGDQVAAILDPDEWDITVAAPGRQAVDPEGREITIHDAVLRAVRRS